MKTNYFDQVQALLDAALSALPFSISLPFKLGEMVFFNAIIF